jgi:hypothetical protein
MNMNPFFPLTPITDFRKLGTGRKKRPFVVVNEEQHRVLFVGKVIHNNPRTTRTTEFHNKETFFMDSGTLRNGLRVSIFPPSERLAELCNKQSEMDRIETWLPSAVSGDILALWDCVLWLRGMPERFCKDDNVRPWAVFEIGKQLEFLSLRELRLLTSIL